MRKTDVFLEKVVGWMALGDKANGRWCPKQMANGPIIRLRIQKHDAGIRQWTVENSDGPAPARVHASYL